MNDKQTDAQKLRRAGLAAHLTPASTNIYFHGLNIAN
jgi:hypothetical protein